MEEVKKKYRLSAILKLHNRITEERIRNTAKKLVGIYLADTETISKVKANVESVVDSKDMSKKDKIDLSIETIQILLEAQVKMIEQLKEVGKSLNVAGLSCFELMKSAKTLGKLSTQEDLEVLFKQVTRSTEEMDKYCRDLAMNATKKSGICGCPACTAKRIFKAEKDKPVAPGVEVEEVEVGGMKMKALKVEANSPLAEAVSAMLKANNIDIEQFKIKPKQGK